MVNITREKVTASNMSVFSTSLNQNKFQKDHIPISYIWDKQSYNLEEIVSEHIALDISRQLGTQYICMLGTTFRTQEELVLLRHSTEQVYIREAGRQERQTVAKKQAKGQGVRLLYNMVLFPNKWKRRFCETVKLNLSECYWVRYYIRMCSEWVLH